MGEIKFENLDEKVEFKILKAYQSDEFDRGYYFISQLLLSKENINIKIEEIELNLDFFIKWNRSLFKFKNKIELSSLDGKFQLLIERSFKRTLIKLIYNELDFEEIICLELQLDQSKIRDLKNQLHNFITIYGRKNK
ncbi:hypothetical protein [Bacillus sp. NPDC077027]|uniref:hypothetical protein n=1 Tax=Bacillus sp. NPDC077027 TaxID=3390548 RepID=UPI003D02BD04